MTDREPGWFVPEVASPLACFLQHLCRPDSIPPILANLGLRGLSTFHEWRQFPEVPAACDFAACTPLPSFSGRLCLFCLRSEPATSSSPSLAHDLRALAEADFAVGASDDPVSAALMRDALQAEKIPFLHGLSSSHVHHLEKECELVLLGRHAMPRQDFSHPLRVAAIMLVYNEADILPFTLSALVEQDIEVHVIDDGSNDGSFEIAESLHRQGKLASLRRSSVGDQEPARWEALLREVEQTAATLEVDWILHHDADEIRTSPWSGLSLRQGIEFVDSLGYTAIDFTVINFLFTTDQEPAIAASPVESLRYFEFPSHEANFTQVKAWKASCGQPALKDSGGHDATFQGRSIYPLKFLIRHYPLRSARQAASKLFVWRKTRFERERQSKGWHVQYDPFQLIECIEPWNSSELHYYDPSAFDRHFLVERLSGCGLFRTPEVYVNRATSVSAIQRYGDLHAEFHAGVQPLLQMVMDQQEQVLSLQQRLHADVHSQLQMVMDQQEQLLTLQQEEREQAQHWRAKSSTTIEETREAVRGLSGEFEAWRAHSTLWPPVRWLRDLAPRARGLAGRVGRLVRGMGRARSVPQGKR
jgi:glycosyltransferase involved in cell wall biosynthesis